MMDQKGDQIKYTHHEDPGEERVHSACSTPNLQPFTSANAADFSLDAL
jgi:hypothetical protein